MVVFNVRVDHEGRQACTVLISAVTRRGALVVGIAYGCPNYNSPAIFNLFCKVPQVNNCLFLRDPLPPCNSLRYVHFGRKVCPAGKYFWLDMLMAADESQKLETALCIHESNCLAAAGLVVDLAT